MKRKMLLIILVSLWSLTDSYAQETIDLLNVFASTGLTLRTEPTKNAKILDTIPYGNKVQILKMNDSSTELTINGLKGRYIKVKHNDLIGYIFSGYLSKLKPSKKWMYWQTLKDYANDEYKKIGPSKKYKQYDEDDSSYVKTGTIQKYTEGIELVDFSEECNYDEKLILTNYSIQEAFLLLTTFNFNYLDAGLDNITNLNVKKKIYHADIKPIGQQQYYRNLTVEKDQNGDIIYIGICFDSEPGSGCASVEKDKNNENAIIFKFSYSCS